MAKRNFKLQTRLRKEINAHKNNNASSSESRSQRQAKRKKKNLSTSETHHTGSIDDAGNASTTVAINSHLGQIHDDVDQLLESYQFLLHAIEILQVHGDFNDADLGGVAFMKGCLRDEGERLLQGIGCGSG